MLIKLQGNITCYSYDGFGRKVTETRPMGNEIRTEYDSHGRIWASQRTRYDYIVCGPLAKTRYCSDTSNVLGTVNATYDKVGNLLTISDDRIQSGPLYTRSYDALNRLSAVQSHYIPGQPST
jgi:YD repeat-containing protein